MHSPSTRESPFMTATAAASTAQGTIRQVIGPVVDVQFASGDLPSIYDALTIDATNPAGQGVAVTCEVQQLLGDRAVRAVAMSSTDGLVRGMEVTATGKPISVPVGECTLGRIFNVLGARWASSVAPGWAKPCSFRS